MLSAHWTQPPQFQQHRGRYHVEMMDAVGIDHEAQARTHTRRKRKADLQPENNERLSKRLSLLNLGMRHHFNPWRILYPLYETSDQSLPNGPPS